MIRLTNIFLIFFTAQTFAQQQHIDGVAAIVGENIILKSDVSQVVGMTVLQQGLDVSKDVDVLMKLQEGVLSSLIDQKVILEMAKLDSIEIPDKDVENALDQQVENFILRAGSEDVAETMLGQSLSDFRREFWYDMRDRLITEQYQQQLIMSVNINRDGVFNFYEEYKDSLPDFPIKMDHNSRIPLRKRIDLIFSFILYEYGGICVSPGTIIYKTEPLVNKLFNHDIITVGSSPRLINNIDYSREPNTYILASKPRTPFISEYKRLLLMTVMNNDLYRLINQESYDILKKVLKENKVNQYHFGPKYDGTYNNNHRLLDISDYLGNEKINFLEPKKLFAVSVPYDILYLRENYHWYLRLSEYQFNRSKLEINRLLKLVSFT